MFALRVLCFGRRPSALLQSCRMPDSGAQSNTRNPAVSCEINRRLFHLQNKYLTLSALASLSGPEPPTHAAAGYIEKRGQ
jgi:hypothetical protein